jgi:hypothetical protein
MKVLLQIALLVQIKTEMEDGHPDHGQTTQGIHRFKSLGLHGLEFTHSAG